MTVEVEGLAVRYGSVAAVDGVSFTAAPGAVLALLGPNGAGKTTTVETCEGYRRPSSGAVRVLGLDPVRDHAALTRRMGVMLQSGGVYPGAYPLEMLRLVASFYPSPLSPADLLERLGVPERPAYRRLSGGEKQRLSLALALVGRPAVVFLDEPTAGLDPQARHVTWDVVRGLRTDGVTVVLTTHYMDEAEALADSVVVVDGGRVVASGTVEELTRGADAVTFRAPAGLDLAGLPGAVEEAPGRYRVEGPVTPERVAAVTAWCAARGVLAEDLRTGRRSLEEVFLGLTGRELR
ncbi:MAG TPA: ABC transporter ATP-binding protein [Frankiaceae bacterium]|nr:ABC transporter ATP-binding protein [Frankiaceae bacterium]